MSEAQAAVSQIPAKQTKLQTNHGHISGRIVTSRKLNTQQGPLILTVLRLPAPDQYSHPSTIELRSSERLGENDTDWSGYVRLGGMPNNWERTEVDRETGESRKIPTRSARNEFTVIEL